MKLVAEILWMPLLALKSAIEYDATSILRLLNRTLPEGNITNLDKLIVLTSMTSLHFSPPFVARRRKGAPCLPSKFYGTTEECAGTVDTMLSALTEPQAAWHSAVAVEGW